VPLRERESERWKERERCAMERKQERPREKEIERAH
jgi:hypothetical protein